MEAVEVFLTHVERDGPLLKLWTQTDRETPALIERSISQLTDQFNRGIGVPDSDSLLMGQLCCAKYIDGIYYRARITSLENVNNGEVSVQFADYGNLEKITLNNLRSLDGFLSPLATIADQAVDFYLAGVMPLAGYWTDSILKFVKEMICYEELKCVFVCQMNGKNFIKLLLQDVDFATFLIDKKIGISITIDTQVNIFNNLPPPSLQMWPKYNPEFPPPVPLTQIVVAAEMSRASEQQRLGQLRPMIQMIPPDQQLSNQGIAQRSSSGDHNQHYNQPGHMAYNNRHNATGFVAAAAGPMRSSQLQVLHRLPPYMATTYQDHHTTPITDVPLNFLPPCLEVNQEYYIRVVLVEDGLNSFIVSMKDMEGTLGKMLMDLNSIPPVLMTRPPMPGTICSARYTRDKSLCRAIIMEVLNDTCNVYYVDFGHSEILPYTEIFELPQRFIGSPKVMSIKICHAGLAGIKVTESLSRAFEEYVTGKYLKLVILPPDGPSLKHYGVLYDKAGESVLDMLMTKLAAIAKITDYPQIPSPQVGATKSVLVSFVDSLSKFYVQLEDNIAAIEAVMFELLAHCETQTSCISESDLHSGLLCCAKYAEDDQWYRALVCNISREGITVNYVDYGNIEVVQVDALRRISPELVNTLDAQAIPCCLTKFLNIPGDEELIIKFTDLTVDKSLIMQVAERLPSGFLVVELHNLSTTPTSVISFEIQKLQNSLKNNAPANDPKGRALCKPPSNSVPHIPDYREHKAESQIVPNESKHLGSGDRYRPGSRTEASTDWRANRDDKCKGDFYDQHNDRTTNHRGDGDSEKPAINKAEQWGKNKMSMDTWQDESWVSAKSYLRLNVPIGETKSAQLVYSENPNHFYVQLTPDAALTDLMNDIANIYPNGGGKSIWPVSVGTACISQFTEDEAWYRAVVLSANDVEAEVQFVDYGNVDCVPIESVQETLDDFLSFPMQGVHCSLHAATPKGSTWTDDEMNNFLEVIDGKSLEVKFLSEKNGLYSVIVKDVDTGKLVNEMFGAPPELQNTRRADKVEPTYTKKVEPAQSKYNEPRSAPVARPAPVVPTVVKVFAFPCEQLACENFEPECTRDVCVSWFISPQQFYVQNLSKSCQLDRMMKDIQSSYKMTQPNVNDLDVGSPIIAKFLGDNSLCRAEIKCLNNESYIVQYVDYGNCDLATKVNMWQIEAKFLRLKKQAIFCSLKDILPVGKDWPKNNNDLDKVFQDEAYQCIFHENIDGKYFVSLMHNGVSVADELVTNGLATLPVVEPELEVIVKPDLEVPMEKQLLDGETLNAVITYVDGAEKFFVQLDLDHTTHIQSLVDKYVEAAISENNGDVPVPAAQLISGQICIATSDKTQWYRAKIVDCCGTQGFYVHFYDYGDCHEVTASQIIPIPNELAIYPAQAVECFLTGTGEVQLSAETEDRFKTETESKTMMIHVDTVIVERLGVTLFTFEGKKLEIVQDIGQALQEVGPILPLKMTMQYPRVFVAHVDSASSIWLQKATDSDLLATLLEHLNTFYEDDGKGVAVESEIGSLVAAKCLQDEQWYRARVVSADGASICVQYIDYGNQEGIDTSLVKALDPSFYNPHIMAVQVSLPVVDNSNLDFTHLTAEAEFVAAFTKVNGKWFSELFIEKVPFTDALVQLGFELMEDYPFVTIVEEFMRLPNIMKGMRASTFVSHADSPIQFWLQLSENLAELQKLQEVLQESVDSFEVLASYKVGDFCSAHFVEDCSWYRVTILEVNEQLVTVRFVDYGSTDVIDVEKEPLKALPLQLAKKEPYAVKFGLNVLPVDNEFSERAIKRFEELVTDCDALVTAEIIKDGVVDLFAGTKSFTNTLIEEDLVGMCFDNTAVFVSHTNSPAEFYVQYQNSTKRLEIMANRLAECESFTRLSAIENGVLCAALFVDDEQYYRAEVIGNTEEGTEVYFIDYGNSAIATELLVLPDDLAVLPPLADRCSLVLPDNVTTWSEEAEETFALLADEGAAIFNIEIISVGEINVVNLVNIDGKNVSNLLFGDISAEAKDALNDIVKTDEVLEEDVIIVKRIIKIDKDSEDQFEPSDIDFEKLQAKNIHSLKKEDTEVQAVDASNLEESMFDAMIPKDEERVQALFEGNSTKEVDETGETCFLLEENPAVGDVTTNQCITQQDLLSDSRVEEVLEPEGATIVNNQLEAELLVNLTQDSSEVYDTLERVSVDFVETDAAANISSSNVVITYEIHDLLEEDNVKGIEGALIEGLSKIEKEESETNAQVLVTVIPLKKVKDNFTTDVTEDETPNQSQECSTEAVKIVGLQLSNDREEGTDFKHSNVSEETVGFNAEVPVPNPEDELTLNIPETDVITNDSLEGSEVNVEIDLNSSGNSHYLDVNSEFVSPDTTISNGDEFYDAVCRMTPRGSRHGPEKIVPGSISRGLSEEELQKYQFTPIDNDNEPEHSLEVIEVDKSQSCPSTPIPREELLRIRSMEALDRPSPTRLKHSERIVPGSISNSSSIEEVNEDNYNCDASGCEEWQ